MIVKIMCDFPGGVLRLAYGDSVCDGAGDWVNDVESISPLSRSIGENNAFEVSGLQMEVIDRKRKFKIDQDGVNRLRGGEPVEFYTVDDELFYSARVAYCETYEDTYILFLTDSSSGLKDVIVSQITKQEYGSAPEGNWDKPINLAFGILNADKGKLPCPRVDAGKYLIADQHVKAVLQVFENDNEVTTGWSLENAADGRSYVVYENGTADVVNINLEGYQEAGELVENPVDVLEYILENRAAIAYDPVNLDDIRAIMTSRRYTFSGAVTSFMNLETFLEYFAVSFDCDYYIDADNTIRFAMIDMANMTPVRTFTDKQLQSFRMREDPEKIENKIQYRYDYDHAKKEYLKTYIYQKQASIQDYGERFLSDKPLDLHFVADHVTAWDVVLRYALYRKLPQRTADVVFPIQEFVGLDLTDLVQIDHPAKIGTIPRLFQIRRIDPFDFETGTVHIKCADRSLLLKGAFRLGDRDTLPKYWTEANEEQRQYAYLCDRSTGRFSDGEQGKAFY